MTAMRTGSAPGGPRAKILCVDDEPAVAAAIRRQLHRELDVVSATSGDAAIGLLDEEEGFAAIVCDLRMPGTGGLAVLAHARASCPDTARVLLTGHADVASAIEAVNEGNVFRFLVKPCVGVALRRALLDAVGYHDTLVAERQLLEETLHGSVAALVDALSLANPLAFSRATRIRHLVDQLVEACDPPEAWQIEIAAMLSQVAAVVLPEATVDKLHRGLPLDEDERVQVAGLPAVADRILAPIPRLEAVRRIIRDQDLAFEAHQRSKTTLDSAVSLGARMLRVATDLDTLEAGGVARADALVVLAREDGRYDPELLAALDPLAGPGRELGPRAITTDELSVGLTIHQDVVDGDGRLIMSRGYVVTESLLDRLQNWRGPAIQEPIFVEDPIGT